MKVLYLHQYFSTRDGATGTRSYEMAKRLLAAGHQVTVVCANAQASQSGLQGPFVHGRREGAVDGIHVIEFELGYSNYFDLPKRSLLFLLFVVRAIGVCLFSRYDLLFATSTPLTVAIPGILMKAFRGKPFVFEVRDLWPEIPVAMGGIRNRLLVWLLEKLEATAYAKADACIGLAPGICEGIRAKSHRPIPVAMIPNGCDLALFQPSRDRSALPKELQAAALVCVFSGAHGRANHLSSVLDAAVVLKRRAIDNIVFAFIGDGHEKPALKERARRAGLNCCYFYPPMPKHQLARVVPACDVGLQVLANVAAFYRGTSPNKFFDFISSGLPVVINYPGWLAELIAQHEVGVVVAPDDPEAFANALIELRNSTTSRESMGRNARHLAEANFNRDDLGQQFVSFLESAEVAYRERGCAGISNSRAGTPT